MLLEGKKALVTGARRSIGRGIAQALADAGCDVGINDVERDTDAETTLDLVRKAGREAAYFDADISSAKAVNRMFEEFLDRFGRVDILVNNPYASESRPFLEITEAMLGPYAGRLPERVLPLQPGGCTKHGGTWRRREHCVHFLCTRAGRVGERHLLRNSQGGNPATDDEHGLRTGVPWHSL